MFAEHNATAAAADGVSRVDRVVRAHIGSNAILDCVVKKGSQFGMVSHSIGRSVTEAGGKDGSGSVLLIEGQLVSEKGRWSKKLIGVVRLWEAGGCAKKNLDVEDNNR